MPYLKDVQRIDKVNIQWEVIRVEYKAFIKNGT